MLLEEPNPDSANCDLACFRKTTQICHLHLERFRAFEELALAMCPSVVVVVISEALLPANPLNALKSLSVPEPSAYAGEDVPTIIICEPDTRFSGTDALEFVTRFRGLQLLQSPVPAPVAVSALRNSLRSEGLLLNLPRNLPRLETFRKFVGGLAHLFNNSLTTILGNASFLTEHDDPAVVGRVNSVIRASERLAAVIRQLLAFAGKGRFTFEWLDVRTEIQHLLQNLRAGLPRHVKLQTSLAQYLPPIQMDRDQLRLLVSELISNASESIPESSEGLIVISTYMEEIRASCFDNTGREIQPGRFLCLEIRDNGAGMEDHVRARLFDPFFSTKFVGRGLGLAAAAGIVWAQDGAIFLRTAQGQGSTFLILFRSGPGDAGSVPASRSSPERPSQ